MIIGVDGARDRPGVVVAGAAMGGLRAAEQLRAAGWTGPVTVVGDERHMPYNRPPLSKEVLAGEVSHAAVAFRTRASVADVTWRLGTAVAAADLTERRVTLADGSTLPYAGLVVATGIRPRRLNCPGPRGGRHVVRTLDDAQALRGELRAGRRLVVIGAGFIGCEVAATARGLGMEVTIVAPESEPMLRPLGERLGAALRRRHEARGVTFRLGRTIDRFLGGADGAGNGHGDDDRATGVVLDDASTVPADVVVEAVGSVPNTEWLAGNGLDLSDGVVCDALLRVEGRPDVVAVGDIARFPNPRYDAVARRVEHWSVPTDSAKRAARTLAAQLTGGAVDETPFAPLPTFWSDQYAERLQSFGAPGLGAADIRLLEGELDADCVVGYHHADGRLVGIVALGGGAAVAAARYRGALAAHA
ncbi:NAD(P)/FAD-dependent oxidoreductase [Yinghuangia seranimata]|uniref:NAD(P)/FAD-dependent oxidoreductase n=1 Tax=Yinghuangia seranimata TaxID=408067 RepID=UPI00248C2456|nr:NAD(P)/FAD-dependent oxidoreductase [Yinghuangia seranimata]MDI2132746.1 NAD(P)/FAD-dependent oxidoreductase [Yinghuangia seranimata]